MTRRWWLAPTLDLVCIVTFILVGAGRHNINDGADWFLMVLWPLAVGWYGVALVTRLYFSDDRPWLRLTITLAVATLIASLAARRVHRPPDVLDLHGRVRRVDAAHRVRVAPGRPVLQRPARPQRTGDVRLALDEGRQPSSWITTRPDVRRLARSSIACGTSSKSTTRPMTGRTLPRARGR